MAKIRLRQRKDDSFQLSIPPESTKTGERVIVDSRTTAETVKWNPSSIRQLVLEVLEQIGEVQNGTSEQGMVQ